MIKMINFTKLRKLCWLMLFMLSGVGFLNANIGPSSVTVSPAGFVPGSTLTYTLTYNVSSPDYEYADYLQLIYPTGGGVSGTGASSPYATGYYGCGGDVGSVLVNNATSYAIGRPGYYPAGGSGCGAFSNGSYTISFQLTVPSNFSGDDIEIPWFIMGDGYGATPHFDEGVVTLVAGVCTAFPPADISQANDPNVCGANVTVPQIETDGICNGVQAVFSEDFNDCASLPTGWSVESTWTGFNNLPGPCSGSLISFQCQSGAFYWGPPANENFDGCLASINDDAVINALGVHSIISPVINLSGGGAYATFDYSTYGFSCTFIVEGFDGTDWVEIFSASDTDEGSEVVSLSDFSNADFQLRFSYDDGGYWNYGVQFDNVVVYVADPNSPATIVNDYTGTDDASGYYPVGQTVVTWTVASQSGIETFTQIITVTDEQDPVITSCVEDAFISLDPGLCDIKYTFEVLGSDNCTSAEVTAAGLCPIDENAIAGAGALSCGYSPTTLIQPFSIPYANAILTGVTLGHAGASGGIASGFITVYIFDGNTCGAAVPSITTGCTPIGVATNFNFNVPYGEAGFVPLDAGIAVSNTMELWVEVVTPGGYLIATPESCGGVETYIYAPSCGLSTPATFASIGFGYLGLMVDFNLLLESQMVGYPDPDAPDGVNEYESGDYIPLGVHCFQYIVEDPYGNTSEPCTWCVTVEDYQNPINNLACNDHVRISVDEECVALINADMILEGGPYGCYDNYSVEIFTEMPSNTWNAEGDVANPVGPGHYWIGIYDETGNNCWSSVTVEDKLPPVIDCSSVTPVIIECYESELAPAILAMKPTVSDNCNNWVLTYTDSKVTSYCTQYVETITRTWTVVDKNNGMTDNCVQIIYKRRATLANLGVPPNWDGVQNDMIECSNTEYPLNQWGNPHPSYTGGPTGIGWTPTSSTGACGTIEVFYNDRVFQSDCGPKILRDWTIIDDCTGQIVTHTQIIRITDSTPPRVCGPEEVLTQAPIVISTNAWSCTGDYIVPKPLICDNCDTNPTYTVTASAGTVVYVPSTKTWIVFGLPEGTHTITYIVRDWCGNTAAHPFLVKVVDAIPPMAACEQYKQVSLTFDGTNSVAKVWAQSFDSGSHDHGCGPVWFKVWRPDGVCAFNIDEPIEIAANKSYFDDEVYYCCGDALIMTTLRVFDVNPGPGAIAPSRMLPGGDLYGHFNDCMTTVDVQEKVPPVMLCQDITITCEDNIHPDHTGYPVAYATCGDPQFKWTDDLKDLNTCNIGFVTRTWEVLKADGSSYSPKIECKQKITVKETLPFDPLTIVFPYISQESCLKNEPAGGTPTWDVNPCNIVDAAIIKVDTFRFVDGACYKILREWVVIDWCVYKANTGAEWNLDEFKYISSNKRAILDPAKFTAADRDGYYRFTEVIMIYDNTPANIHVEDYCIGIVTCVTAPETHKFTATSSEEEEDCGGEYEWTYVIHDVCCDAVIQYSSNNSAYKLGGPLYAGGVIGQSSKDDLKGPDAYLTLLPSLAVGEYRVTWTLKDGCGNVNQEFQYITVADKKAPTPFMVDISTATMTNCMVEMTARFFDKGACNNQCLASYDNCADVLYFTFTPVLPKLDPTWTLDAYGLYYFNPTSGAKSNRVSYLAGNAHSWNPVKNTSGQVFTGPTRTVNVDVYVWDKFALNEDCDDGNYDFATVLVTINSIDDDCNGPVFPLNGMIAAKNNGAGINNVSVEAKKDGESKYTTTANGAYTVNVPGGINVVTPSKKDDYTNGVSTLDLVLIQKHLLGLGALNADQLVAADANANTSVTGADIKQLRDLILGVNNVLPSNDSWVFAPKSAEINMNAAASLNFSGIKVGDINGDAKANFDGTNVAPRNANVINMVVNEAAVEAGNEIEVAFTAENFNNVRGTQMTLNLNGLSFAGVNAGAMDVTAENFGLIRDGIVTMSWNNANGATVTDGAVLFTLKLNANVNGNLSNLMSAGSQITAAEAYTTDALNVNGLNVTFRGTEEVVFELYQNEPNPFAEKTVVGFNLPEAGEYTLNVYDVTGRILKTVNSNGVKGYNKVELNSNDLSAGVLYYQLDSNNFTATKRMIVIK